MIVSSVGLVLATLVFMGVANERAIPWILAAAGAFTSTVAIIVGGNGIVPFYAAAIVILVLMFLRVFVGSEKGLLLRGPGYVPLLLFAIWSIFMTILGPVLFAGIPVLAARGGIDSEVSSPSELQYSISNAAQAVYLVLGLSMAIFLAKRRHISSSIPAALFWMGVGLSSLNWICSVTGLPWPSVFDNSPNVRYISFESDGVTPRFRGIFAEPSALALFCLTALVYFLSSAYLKTGRARMMDLAGAGVSLFLTIVCASGTSVAGAAILMSALGGGGIARFLLGKSKWPPSLVIAAVGLFCVFVIAGKSFLLAVVDVVRVKLNSDSYEVRASANSISLEVMLDTWGLGAGLGSSRAGALYTMLLSCVGIPGVILFVWAMAALVISSWQKPEWRPSATALATFLLIKTISGGNLSDPVLWILIGACGHASWRSRALPAMLSSVPLALPTRQIRYS